jgi:hypothetical protein
VGKDIVNIFAEDLDLYISGERLSILTSLMGHDRQSWTSAARSEGTNPMMSIRVSPCLITEPRVSASPPKKSFRQK